jgi:NAD(P)-dependent dehydrogenase (short-subunit alcohol dehydrogenase family)
MKHVALITGGSRGLGAALAQFLVTRGDHVIITGRTEETLRRQEQQLRSLGEVEAIAGDVSSAAHRTALRRAAERTGRLDLLVNNASELGPSPLQPLAQLSIEELQRIYKINVAAPLGLIQTLLPLLEQSRGLVVNISSDAARGGYAGWGGYGASKAALDLVSLTLAGELRPQNIGVVAVDPGDLRTDMHQAAYPGEDIADRPLPEVTIPFWAWLLSQDPRLVTGRRFNAQADTWELAA